jgi:hypothetical protein
MGRIGGTITGERVEIFRGDGSTVFVVRLHGPEPCPIASPRCTTLRSEIRAVRSSPLGETDVHTFYYLIFLSPFKEVGRFRRDVAGLIERAFLPQV